ncbi:MAG: hypothetical protein JW927_13420 [Deltaproteobacteria bacterium]|nr:hypothetical protein [Deltaproteobacteria bacterium]
MYIHFLCSLVLGAIGAWLISRWGSVFNLLDRSNHRSSHKGVIPKGGGIGILAAFIIYSMTKWQAVWYLIIPACLKLGLNRSMIWNPFSAEVKGREDRS